MSTQHVFFFGEGKAEGTLDKTVLGGKGVGLAEMTSIGFPVPPGFTISCQTCGYFAANKKHPENLESQVLEALAKLEKATGKKFGDKQNPLFVSVRSGAAVSMPGMMDTILNLGINPDSVQALAKNTGNERFAYDSYRRFIQMFGNVVKNVDSDDFEHIITELKKEKNKVSDTDLSADDLKELVARFLKLYKETTKEEFPTDPKSQLWSSINAVFMSWGNPRAVAYRALNDIKGLVGTAVNVQSMVFGNMGEDSGTGVAFTRNPADGENKFYGEYLMNAQGEDIVAGIRTPLPISALEKTNKKAYDELIAIRHKLEEFYTDVQDIEFTIERSKLFMLQTRSGKRTIFAWLKTQLDLVDQKLITMDTAISRIPASELNKLFAPIFDQTQIKNEAIEKDDHGINASPGAACGKIVLTSAKAEEESKKGVNVVLVRKETSAEDITGMHVSKGVLTQLGGITSHAAVVARGMGCPCVAGAGNIKIDQKQGTVVINGKTLKEGDTISIDGFNGNIYCRQIKVIESEIFQVLKDKMKSSDSELYRYYIRFINECIKRKKMGVRTNSDTPYDTEIAVKLGAEGIGLTRTEHMFFDPTRIISIRKLIMLGDFNNEGNTEEERKKNKEKYESRRESALKELLPFQKSDFIGILKALNGRPATVRLIDPPLHEFLPGHDNKKGQEEMAKEMGITVEQVEKTVASMKEENPMLGFRGCRLTIVYPDILCMQVRALMEAAVEVSNQGIEVHPEIMVPLIGDLKEFTYCKKYILETIEKVFKETGKKVDYKIGTMIEVPRACLKAEEIAKEAEFFSFGTNDLTQMTCGFSRDDAARFLNPYVQDEDKHIYDKNPFEVLDQNGVGLLMNMAVTNGRKVKPDLKIGICGEHGGETSSVKFCASLGLSYVSCSPLRVPVAILSAAQYQIKKELDEQKKK